MMSREYRPRSGSRISGEVAVDPHVLEVYHSQIEDVEIQDHRQVYVGVHIPLRPRKHHHHQRHHHHRRRHRSVTLDSKDGDTDAGASALPTDKVRFILGGEENDLEQHKMFTQMASYHCDKDGNEEWREMARWLKFEEDVEEGGDRWSKPHVGTLSLYSLFELRSALLRGTVLLDMNATNLTQIADLVLDDMVNKNHLEQDSRQRARDVLLKKHRHQGYKAPKKSKSNPMSSFGSFAKKTSLAGIKRSDSSQKATADKNLEVQIDADQNDGEFPHLPSAVDLVGKEKESGANGDACLQRADSDTCLTFDANFMKKIPAGAEASNVLVGEMDFLKKPVVAFVRLENASLLGDLTEVPIPTRFIFFMMGPPGTPGRYHEVGRAIATLMSDEIFHEVAYKAQCREDLLAGIDEFLMQVTVLPPGEWDPSIRIEPPDAVPLQGNRLDAAKPGGNGDGEGHDPAGDREEQLQKTGRLCGGLINDIKRRAPWYWSDFKDALNPQCIASIIFIYFACLTPIITFGGLMGTKTGKNMAAMEQILAGGIGGVLFSLFGGQPLIILGATGPMLVFEEILYTFCESVGLDYLPFRLWIGIWTMLYCFVLVITDASALVRYFTRFTEESFATLIALIFIVEGCKKLVHVLHDSPVPTGYIVGHSCLCLPKQGDSHSPRNSTMYVNATSQVTLDYSMGDCSRYGGELVGDACHDNVFLLSLILAVGTFFLAVSLKGFRTSSYFPTKVRAVISDFAILISIMIMVGVDLAFGVNTPKLDIPLKFQPTASEKRGWVVPPLGKNPVWTIPAAAIPALLATILVFMDQQITALIVNRREHKLKKGAGYHLDLLLVAIIIGICSLLGLPWVVAATVLSVGHVQSLFVESSCTAPGEKAQFLGVREQRVTGTMIFILIGLTVFIAPILKFVPMPVLFGLFFYMGFSALKGLQFFERLKIIFMPAKHQPDLMYLRQVPVNRIHIFTVIQFICLAVLWIIKSTSAALIFPVMVLMLVAVRKVMEKIFNLHELEVLDDLMPESIKKQKAEKETDSEDSDYDEDDDECNHDHTDGTKELTDGKEQNGTANCESPMNISEEMCKTSLWKQFVKDGSTKKPENRKGKSGDKYKHKHKHHHHHKNKRNRHKNDREGSADEEGLWMLEKKKGEDEDGSDDELHRKLSVINEDKNDVVIDMEQIQKSLLELNDFDDVPIAGDDADPSPEGEAEAVV